MHKITSIVSILLVTNYMILFKIVPNYSECTYKDAFKATFKVKQEVLIVKTYFNQYIRVNVKAVYAIKYLQINDRFINNV